MHVSGVLFVAAISSIATAQDLDDIDDIYDVAAECFPVCAPIITVGLQCDAHFDEDDSRILDCMFSTLNVAINECVACITPYHLTEDDDFNGERPSL